MDRNMVKKINRDNLIFKSEEFRKDKYKFYIALKILISPLHTKGLFYCIYVIIIVESERREYLLKFSLYYTI